MFALHWQPIIIKIISIKDKSSPSGSGGDVILDNGDAVVIVLERQVVSLNLFSM